MKKLFTLMVLLVAIVTGAWAQTELCSATVPSGQTGTFNNTQGLAQNGCTLKWSGLQGGDNVVTVDGVDYYKMGSNDAYVQLALSSGSFEAGDVVTMTLTSNGSNKNCNMKVGTSSTGSISVSKGSTGNLTYTLKATDIETDGSIKIYRGSSNGSAVRVAKFSVSGIRSLVAYTVTFNPGSNGTCTPTSLTEESAGAGITLPTATPKEGYVFNGWFTAATGGTKVGVAGNTYKPHANVEIFAQYSQLAAPTIEFDNYAPSTMKGSAVTLTANVTGAPDPTVTWYQNETASTTGGTKADTGLTFQPDVTAEGTFYYYAVASNSEGNATSQLVTLTVINPDVTISGNSYYVAKDEEKVANAKVICDDISMQFVGFSGSTNKAGEDTMISSVDENYVASISTGTNAWGVEFTPTANGILKVGVIINKDKTFSITNVNSFSYVGKNGADPAEDIEGTINSGSYKTPNEAAGKMYVEVTINVVAGTKYKFSVAGSKIGFYGFKFTPTVPVTITSAEAASFSSTEALDFSAVEGITAYKATAKSDSYVHLDEVAQVPAGAGVIVKGAEGIYNVPVATGDVAELEGNLLVGTAEATYTVGGDYGKVFKYVKTQAGVVGFQKAKADWTCQIGHAYLMYSEGQAREFIGIFGDDVVTGIEAIDNSQLTIDNDAPAYNLAGQKVGKGYKGIVIINGKKVVK